MLALPSSSVVLLLNWSSRFTNNRAVAWSYGCLFSKPLGVSSDTWASFGLLLLGFRFSHLFFFCDAPAAGELNVPAQWRTVQILCFQWRRSRFIAEMNGVPFVPLHLALLHLLLLLPHLQWNVFRSSYDPQLEQVAYVCVCRFCGDRICS